MTTNPPTKETERTDAMLDAKTLINLQKQLWDARIMTDDSLEQAAIGAAIAAIGQMVKRAKQQD